MTMCFGRRTNGFEEQVHPYGEVGTPQKTSSRLLDAAAGIRHLLMPAGCADDHLLVLAQARSDVSRDGGRSGEIDHDVDVAQAFRSQCARVFVLPAAKDANVVAAGFGDLFDQRSGFSAT